MDALSPDQPLRPDEFLTRLRQHSGPELAAVDGCIRRWLDSDVPLIREVGEHLIRAGGKRLRPLMVLLVAGALGARGEVPVTLAAIIEFIHTATLLHDDVVDESDLRRGRQTANAVYGNAASVLVGDFLYSRSFQMMVSLGLPRVMEILADTTNAIAEGEVLQLIAIRDPDFGESRYYEVIRRKTAILFAAAARLGVVAAGQSATLEQQLATAGLELGMAFQIADDALDYSGEVGQIGKNLGDDLAQGKLTLPLLLALKRAEAAAAARLRQILDARDRERLPEVVQLIRESDALAGTLAQARTHAAAAREGFAALPDSAERDLLLGLCDFALARDH
jgi:octaprenyl-diphosphate synthase